MTRTIAGIIATAAWLLVAALLVVLNWESAKQMPLNNWGDFLSGVVAPIAFFWLILGYFQQGDELRQNTAALLAQEKELARQAQETAALVTHYSKQAEATSELARLSREAHDLEQELQRRKARPVFVSAGGQYTPQHGTCNLRNAGGAAYNLSVEPMEGTLGADIAPPDLLQAGAGCTINIRYANPDSARFRIKYTDSLGNRGEAICKFHNGSVVQEHEI